jgi:hypothetical protein
MRILTLLLLAAALLCAQPTIAPSRESVGSNRGSSWGDYNIRNSFETGYRFANIEGNRGKYRSDVNFLNGVRLLGSSLTVNSKDGKGKYFDEFLLNTQGLGNDPYQFANLRLEKNRLYRYEMTWRSNDYFNPGLTLAFGQHLQDLNRRMQDHQFTFRPQSRFQFFAGFSGNHQAGPALSTINLFDTRGNIFPYFENVRRQQNEYRIGGQVQAAGFKILWQRGWEFFKEDTTASRTGLAPTLDPTITNTTLSGLRRDEPVRGDTPHWRVNLFTEKKTWFAINGRFTSSSGRRNYIYDEFANGTVRNSPLNRQTLVFGDARRPVTTANLTVSVFPTSTLTLTNYTGYSQVQMNGDNRFQQITNGNRESAILNFQYLGVRALTNSTIADLALRPWISVQGGYQFADRRIRSAEKIDDSGFTDLIRAEQNNQLHAGTLGFRLRPVKGLTLVADGEMGRQNRPFYTTSEKDYHAFGLRAEYKQKTYRLAASTRVNYNFNSVSLFRHSSRARNYTFDAAWTPKSTFSLDAGYQKLHQDTLTGLAYFQSFNLIENESSFFVSNVHAAHFGARTVLYKKLDVFIGMNITKDTGGSNAAYTANPVFLAAQSFPLTFASPMARFSYRYNERLRFNAGYQFYDYGEKNLTLQDYRAHTGFLSVLWSF